METPEQAAPRVEHTAGASDRDLFGKTPKGRADWSHRRGEPRLFAIIWMIYLMGASALMLAATGASRAIAPSVVRPASTAMLVAAMAGVVALWPMTRLCQEAPRRPWRAAAGDLVVMLIPACALILPQGLWFLAGWSFGVLAALIAAFVAWGIVVGAVLAPSLHVIGRMRASGVVRALAMCVVLAIAGGGVVGGAIVSVATVERAGADQGPRIAMWSPVTTVVELTRPRETSALAARVGPGHWRAIGIVAGAGLTVWLAGAAVGLATRRDRA